MPEPGEAKHNRENKQLRAENERLRQEISILKEQLEAHIRGEAGVDQYQPAHPHDTGYKYLLTQAQVFWQLIKTYAAGDWADKIAENSLQRLDKSYVMQDFRHKELDLIYQAKHKGQKIIFYCLMELQSTVDHLMPLRLLMYMIGAWQGIVKDLTEAERRRKGIKLPLIIPMVLYNGTDSWTAPVHFRDLLQTNAAFAPIQEFIVDFKYDLINVQTYSETELLEQNNLVSMVFYLDQCTNAWDIVSRLRKLSAQIKKMAINEYAILTQWIIHILSRYFTTKDQAAVSKLLEDNKPEEVEKMLTNVEKVLDKTVQDARNEGRDESKREIALAALKEGSSVDYIVKITGLDIKTILELKEKLQN